MLQFLINPKYSSLTTFIHSLPSRFEDEGELIYDGRNKVKIFTLDGEKIVVKRFKKPLFHQRIDYTFIRPSKAKRAYSYGMRLMELNVSTPEPIACIEEHAAGLFLRGYFVSTFCGDPDARIIREEPESHDDLVNALAHFIVDMHEKGFVHGDTNLSNFLYRKDSTPLGYHITTIDINRSHFHANPTRKECLDSLMRMTHVRPALTKIVARYAELRGWDKEECVNAVLEKLTKFEKRKEMKRKIMHSKSH